MKCPYKKITKKMTKYPDNEDIPSVVSKVEEEFGVCDEFNCIAYYEEGILDSDDFISHCKRLEKETVYEKDCD